MVGQSGTCQRRAGGLKGSHLGQITSSHFVPKRTDLFYINFKSKPLLYCGTEWYSSRVTCRVGGRT